jgi:O-antigen/teichoic acid export membrane protein
MATGRKITYNALSLSLSKILSTALALVSIGMITRYLGADGFGSYATVMAFFSLFGSVADLGLYAISTREISRENADENKIISSIFSLRIFSSLIVFIITPLLVLILPYSFEVKIGIVIAAASFVFSSSYLVLNGIFQKKLAMHKVAFAELIGKIFQVGIIYLTFLYSLGFVFVISSLLFSMVVNFVLVFIFSRKYIQFHISIDWAYWKKFLGHSLPVGASAVITFLYFKTDTIILSFIKGSADVGIYNAAYKVMENLTFFPAMIVGLTLPLISRYIFTNKAHFTKISNDTFKVFFVLVLPLGIGIFLLAKDIILVIGGPGFDDSVFVLRVLVFALVFIFFGNYTNNILLAGNQQKQMMKVLSFCAAFNIIANLILIPVYSYRGAAVTSALTEFLVMALTFYLIKRNMQFFPRAEKLSRIVFANILFALGVYFLRLEVGFILTLALAMAFYIFLLWITKAVTRREIGALFSKELSSSQPLPDIV